MGGKFDEGDYPLARTKCMRKFWELGLEVQYIEMADMSGDRTRSIHLAIRLLEIMVPGGVRPSGCIAVTVQP